MLDVRRQSHLSDLYNGFFAFYQGAFAGDEKPAHEKVRLQLTTVFFDDLDLLKTMRPIFESGLSNVEEKRAAARAAYFDALTIHNRTVGGVNIKALKWETVSEKDVTKGNF